MAAFVSPVLAKKPPDKQVYVWGEYFEVDCSDYGDFDHDVVIDSIFTYTDITFYNEEGDPIYHHGHTKIEGTITNKTTGTEFTDKASISLFYPHDETEIHERGVSVNLHYKGAGVVVKIAGRVIVDADGNATFAAGQNSGVDFEKLTCEGLAGL
jgi:hypothetical protein